MINYQAILHIPNSNMAYPIDNDNIYILLQVAKDNFDKVEIIIGDPHDYVPDANEVYHWIIRTKPHCEMTLKGGNSLFDYYEITTKLPYYRAKYIFLLYKDDDIYMYSSKSLCKVDLIKDDNKIYNNFEYFCFPYLNEEDLVKPVKWIKDTIWYQIFPERFCCITNNDKKYLPWGSVQEGISNKMFFGGNLLGITSKIPYLKELGITGIYFTPIFDAPSTHKYDTRDYFKIDESFGTNNDFKQLVEICHENGIKVMLDGVFNHCGWEHPFFQDVVKHGKKSIYYDCFYIEHEPMINFDIKNGLPSYKGRIIPNYRTFAFTPYMPKIKSSHPIWEKYLLDVCKFWITEYDIDAWRLDVSNEVSHTFWRKFRALCNTLKPEFYILGENWEDSNPWLGNDQLNAVMNYELSYPIWNFFGNDQQNKIDSLTFTYQINNLLIKYNQNIANNMFNLIDSHDTMRIMYRCGDNKELVKLCYLFLFTFPGSPSIYYGDEVGLTGKNDPDNRRCMIWDKDKQNLDIYNFIKKLINLRKLNDDFKLVTFKWLYTLDNILIYQKNHTFIIINNNDSIKDISLPIVLKNKKVTDIYNNLVIQLNDTIILNAYGYYIFIM